MAGRPGTLPWNMATFTGLEPATTLSDNFSFLNNQINDSGAGFTTFAVDTGSVNNLVVTLASAPVAYEAGMMVVTVPAFTNTGASVINVNALGNVSIVNAKSGALTGGELPLNFGVTLVYNGASFVIVGNQYQPVSQNYTTAANQTLLCDGASSIAVNYTANGNLGSKTLTLTGVRIGVPTSIVVNFAGFTGTLFLVASGYSTVLTVQGVAGIQTALVSTAGTFWQGNGMVIPSSGFCMVFSHV